MKIFDILTEVTEEEHQRYVEWQRACRAAFPNCTFVGSDYQGQAVDWMSDNNEIAGDWKDGRGVVYKPGSNGRETIQIVEAPRRDV